MMADRRKSPYRTFAVRTFAVSHVCVTQVGVRVGCIRQDHGVPNLALVSVDGLIQFCAAPHPDSVAGGLLTLLATKPLQREGPAICVQRFLRARESHGTPWVVMVTHIEAAGPNYIANGGRLDTCVRERQRSESACPREQRAGLAA